MKTDTLSVGCVGETQCVKLFVKTAFVQDAKKRKDIQVVSVTLGKLQFLVVFFKKSNGNKTNNCS